MKRVTLLLTLLCGSILADEPRQADVDAAIKKAEYFRDTASSFKCAGNYAKDACIENGVYILGLVEKFLGNGHVTPAVRYSIDCTVLSDRLVTLTSTEDGDNIYNAGLPLLEDAYALSTFGDFPGAISKANAAGSKFFSAMVWFGDRYAKLASLRADYKTLADKADVTDKALGG